MEQIDFRAYFNVLKRRWLLLVAPIVLIAPLALLVAYILPPSYSATARILIESQQIPSALAQSTVTLDVRERIALIEQRLTTRENLLAVASRFNVFNNRGDISPTDRVRAMRESLRINGVSLGRRGGGPVTGVNIRFVSDRPQVAARVANEFLNLVLEQNLQQRNARAFETSAYFRDEVERLSRELAAHETRITQFKIDNQDALPDSLDFRRQQMANAQQRVFQLEGQVAALNEQRARIEEALATGNFIIAEGRSLEAQEVQRLQRALVQQRTIYTDDHPSVRTLLARIRVLENELSPEVRAELNDGDARERAEERLREQMAALEEQVETLLESIDGAKTRVAQLEASIARTPQVELQINALQRDFQSTQQLYKETVLKQARAETGERLEVNQQAERFEVIEQAEVPAEPDSPNRLMIAAAGLGGSVGLGFALMVLAELLNQSVRTPSDLERRLDLSPIATIPYIRLASEVRRRKWFLRTLLAVTLLVIPTLVFMVDQYYIPLPLLMDRVGEKLGLDSLMAMIERRF